MRGDLWTNWLLLAARTVHWFNPVAWWTVGEMQAQREAACDDLALVALNEADRSAYATTIVELAAGLSPSAIAPGLIGLFSSNSTAWASTSGLAARPWPPALSSSTLTTPRPWPRPKRCRPQVVVTLPDGCCITGVVTDAVAGKPAAGALVVARRVDQWGEFFAATDAAGNFRMVVPEGRYDFLAEANDRVCAALTDRECLAREEIELPPFRLIGGGFISGQVVNTATGESVAVSDDGSPIMLGLYGPSQPPGSAISPLRLAAVDKAGRFTLRAAPGENFPYFVNIRGVRMAWDTQQQPPVVVKEGETTTYNVLITPEVPLEAKRKAARKLVEALSKKPSDRTAQMLLEFRKLSHTVDETELWCLLMRELVAIGRGAVPQLCEELDQTSEDRMLRRLGFALRAIGDARAVPALIRAIPRTLLPSSSDYGLDVGDKGLMDFMQKHDLDRENGGTYFHLGRPVGEITGALRVLTGQEFDGADMSLSEDPRRQVMQRRLDARQAQRWQAWWEANWRRFTNDAAYQKVNLNVADEPLPPAPEAPGKAARLSGEWSGAVLSPANEKARYAWHTYDLDTGYRPAWPAGVPRDEAARDPRQLADWAEESGVDLICVAHRSADGTETYVAQALGGARGKETRVRPPDKSRSVSMPRSVRLAGSLTQLGGSAELRERLGGVLVGRFRSLGVGQCLILRGGSGQRRRWIP